MRTEDTHSNVHDAGTFGTKENKSAFMKLGTVLERPVTPAQARREVMDWECEQIEVMTTDFEMIPGFVANRRDDTKKVFDVVNQDSYGEITLDMWVELLEATGLMVSLGGVDYGGGRPFMMLDMGEAQIDNDPHHRYLLSQTSFDKTSSMWTRPIGERYWCRNLNSSIRRAKNVPGEVTLRHSKNVGDRVEAAKLSLSSAVAAHDLMDAQIRELIAQETMTTDDKFIELIETTFGERPTPFYDPETERTSTVRQDNWDRRLVEVNAIRHGATCDNIVNTDYGSFSAINEWEINRGAGSRNSHTSARRVIAGLDYSTRAAAVLLAN